MFIADNYRVWVKASCPRMQRIAGLRLAAVLNRAFGLRTSWHQDQKSEALIVSMYVRSSSV
ncbi:MAG TPA: hypothetical protein VK700_00245 [Steroidobacteraceae bacterium]|jgi:hypothetical protein|nr:hypothetical protein [Steroidobacteraceae bacterium]